MQLKYTLFSSISMLAFSSLSVFSQTEKMNVLFLMADDMRPELGCYGVKEVKTPNIDRFAASGLLFQNAYCNIPVSGASRASLLTGVYPHYPDRFVNYSAYASKDCPTAIPISRWFTSHGYYTISNGKVFHHLSDHANSWSEPPYRKHRMDDMDNTDRTYDMPHYNKKNHLDHSSSQHKELYERMVFLPL